MAIRTTGAFVAGAVAGWKARSFFGTSREALLLIVRHAQGLREQVMREVASQAEWFQDLAAEGRLRYEHIEVSAPVDASIPPDVASAGRGPSA